MSSESLRRVWTVIHGYQAPQGEVENARKIANHLRSKLNLVKVLPGDLPVLDFISKITNIVVVGGPDANRWAMWFNQYTNPRWSMVIQQDYTPDQDYAEWVAQHLQVDGIVMGDRMWNDMDQKGIIGVGSQKAPRIRPLKVIHIAGNSYCDTCAMGQAFREGQEAGVYTTGCVSDIPFSEPCPEKIDYTKIT